MGVKHRVKRSASVEERFMAYVQKTTTCWVWTGHLTKSGYGCFRWKTSGRRAHRVAYQLFKGQVPTGKVVMHNCDNRPCVNPEHLSLGTHLDNMRDMVSKGRSCSGDRTNARMHPELRQGERNGRAKLSETDVRTIRRSYERYTNGGNGIVPLASKFGVSPSTIARIIKKEIWSKI